MSFLTDLVGWVRGLTLMNLSEGQQSGPFPQFSTRGELLVNQVLPPYAEAVRQGDSWVAVCTTAVAAVQALPTTAAHFTLWNSDTNNAMAKSFIIDAVGAICVVSAGAASMLSLAAMVNVLPLTAQPATADNPTISTLTGRSYGGKAKFSRSATVVDDKWWPLGQGVTSGGATATAGLVCYEKVEGRIIVPPGYALSLATLAVNGTLTAKPFLLWHEAQLPVRVS